MLPLLSAPSPRDLPPLPGTYALLLALPRDAHLPIGRLGAFDFPRGDYVYVGSARGAGGLAARVRHHWQIAARPHWHIDYVRRAAQPVKVWYQIGEHRAECVWARALVSHARVAAPRLGASDCACVTHLWYVEDAARVEEWLRGAAR